MSAAVGGEFGNDVRIVVSRYRIVVYRIVVYPCSRLQDCSIRALVCVDHPMIMAGRILRSHHNGICWDVSLFFLISLLPLRSQKLLKLKTKPCQIKDIIILTDFKEKLRNVIIRLFSLSTLIRSILN